MLANQVCDFAKLSAWTQILMVRLCKPGLCGRTKEWAVDPLPGLLSNKRLGEVHSNLAKCTSPNRLLLGNKKKKDPPLVLLILLLFQMALVCSMLPITSHWCVSAKATKKKKKKKKRCFMGDWTFQVGLVGRNIFVVSPKLCSCLAWTVFRKRLCDHSFCT